MVFGFGGSAAAAVDVAVAVALAAAPSEVFLGSSHAPRSIEAAHRRGNASVMRCMAREHNRNTTEAEYLVPQRPASFTVPR